MTSRTRTRAAQGSETTHRLELARDHSAPQIARRWLADRFGAELDQTKLEALKLLGSELVTNAVVHGTGRILVQAHLSMSRLFVEVADDGSGFTPPAFSPDRGRTSGWGLHIVADESVRWGVVEGAARVWFELDRRARGGSARRPAARGPSAQSGA